MKVLTKSLLLKAFLLYELIGWTGYIPEAIRNLEIHLPLSYAGLFWGWPDRFLQRMEQVNTRVVLVNLHNILYQGRLRHNIDLSPGDVVVVHRHVLAKLGWILDQLVGPTGRIRALENTVEAFQN